MVDLPVLVSREKNLIPEDLGWSSDSKNHHGNETKLEPEYT